MKNFLKPFAWCLISTFLFSTATETAFAKKRKKKYRKVSFKKPKRSKKLRMIKVPESEKKAAFEKSAIAGTAGFMMWNDVIEPAPFFGADYRLALGKAFIPFGFNYWSGNLAFLDYSAADYEFRMSVMSIDTGIGYNIAFNDSFALPLGLRVGHSTLKSSASGPDFSFEDSLSGFNLTPTLGAAFAMGNSLSLAYDFRVPIYVLGDNKDEGEDEDQDEDEDSSSIPMQNLLSLNLHF